MNYFTWDALVCSLGGENRLVNEKEGVLCKCYGPSPTIILYPRITNLRPGGLLMSESISMSSGGTKTAAESVDHWRRVCGPLPPNSPTYRISARSPFSVARGSHGISSP